MICYRAIVAAFLGVCISVGIVVGGDGIIELSVTEGSAGVNVPARIRVSDRSGKDYLPEGAVVVPIAKDRWFAGVGAVRIRVPAGEVTVRVERGTEYRPVIESVRVEDGKTVRHEVKLERWIDMGRRGYVSGENHLHVPASKLGAMVAAEGLDFGTALSWWNGPRAEIHSGAECVEEMHVGDEAIVASVCDAEVEHSWGAVYLIGLKEPITIASNGRRSNLAFVREAREQGALICYQAGWSREVLVDALLGYVDVVNVCNNNFHRYKYQPRKRYSNLLDVEGLPDYPNTPEDMMRMNFETYYRLLNCGLRPAAGAGSATGAKSTPVGYNRAYVRAGTEPTLEEFLEAWREGRNFVTNGPMVFFRTDKGKQPGDTIALPAAGGKVNLEVAALSEQPLRSLELVANGKVVGTADIGEDQHEARLKVVLDVKEGMWVGARCTEEDRLLSDEALARYRGAGSLPEEPCRLRFAHSSPIYVTVGGKGARVASSVAEARKMLEGFEGFARKTAAGGELAEILDALPTDVRIPTQGPRND
mgnify:CR=1 FL=1